MVEKAPELKLPTEISERDDIAEILKKLGVKEPLAIETIVRLPALLLEKIGLE